MTICVRHHSGCVCLLIQVYTRLNVYLYTFKIEGYKYQLRSIKEDVNRELSFFTRSVFSLKLSYIPQYTCQYAKS